MSRRFLIALSLLACQGALAADSTLNLAIGQDAPIALEENPTTGYSWQLDEASSVNLDILRIRDDGFSRPPGGSGLGAPGIHNWTVEGVTPGQAHLEFIYERAWEHTPAKRSTVDVEVQ
jgi:inhibitor of cysteine peptidase